MFFQQAAGIHIQMLGEPVYCHIRLNRLGQLGGTAFPFPILGRHDLCHGFQHRVRRLLPKLILCMVKLPNQAFLVFAQIQPLIRLVSAYYLQSRLAICPLFLLHQERPIRAAQQAGCTGNHLKTVSRRLLSGMVDDQDADAISVSKFLQLADHLIVAGVAVTVTHRLPDFLQGIHDNEFDIAVFPNKLFQLFIQAAADHFSVGGEVEGACPLHAEHTEHPAL